MPPPHPSPADVELNLLYDWDTSLYPPQWRRAVLGSIVAHAIFAVLIFVAPPVSSRAPTSIETVLDRKKYTPLISPIPPRPFELTQREANRGRIAKEVTLDSLLPRRQESSRNSPPPRPFEMPRSVPPTPPAPIVDPTPPPLGTSSNLPAVAPPRIEVNEKPQLTFENPGVPGGSVGTGRTIATPQRSVDEAVQATLRKRPTGGLIVTDIADLPSGAGATLSATPQQGRAGSSLELLSDPQGVDFKPYLIRVLAAVRRNWFAVIPESARLGQRGRVYIQFSISRQGSVPKLVISLPSGVDSLDRAAVAGISASNPFPPLPGEFKGEQIRLQLSFVYNLPAN